MNIHRDASFGYGDLIAMRHEGEIHLKRVVALPGDRIELEGLRLLVDGQRIEDRILNRGVSTPPAWLAFDADHRRQRSRWKPSLDSSWRRDPQRIWRSSEVTDNSWLVYHHQSLHDHGRPTPVWDDYPFNLGLSRTLFAVDRFKLTGENASPDPLELRVAFWSEDGWRQATVRVPAGKRFTTDSLQAADAKGQPPVSAENPVAVRAKNPEAALGKVVLHRAITYRLRPHDEVARYPLTVPEDHCFVLGDNVPVAIDSRNWGTIPIQKIIGVVR